MYLSVSVRKSPPSPPSLSRLKKQGQRRLTGAKKSYWTKGMGSKSPGDYIQGAASEGAPQQQGAAQGGATVL